MEFDTGQERIFKTLFIQNAEINIYGMVSTINCYLKPKAGPIYVVVKQSKRD